MCGRYAVTTKEIAKHFGLKQGAFEFVSYNVAPTQTVPIVLVLEGQRTATSAQWGLLPQWVKDRESFKASIFNARSESVTEKASFKGPLRYKRCTVPASGFYEWKQTGGAKTPHYIQLEDEAPMGFAGLYDIWEEELVSCTILTTTPNALMKTLHNRMPVILKSKDYARWLNPKVTQPEAVLDLLEPFKGKMRAHAVSKAVGNVQNNYRGLIEAVHDHTL